MEGELKWPATSLVPGGDSVRAKDKKVSLGRVRTWRDERMPFLRQAQASGVSDMVRKGGDIRTSVCGVNRVRCSGHQAVQVRK